MRRAGEGRRMRGKEGEYFSKLKELQPSKINGNNKE